LIHAAALCLQSQVLLVSGPSSLLPGLCRDGLPRPFVREIRARREFSSRSPQHA
jgi:hypothetical protein